MIKSVAMERHPLLFRYPGGKYYAINVLKSFWENVEHDEYREPFVGGGSVFFNKQKVCYNWLNDIDKELITTYQIISDTKSRNLLINLLKNEIASPERWKEVFNFVPSNDLEIAYKYFYLNRTSFSGKLSSPAWGYREKRSLPPHRWHERINPCGQKLEQVKLTHEDFEPILNAPSKGKKVLMYIDPPYFNPPKNKHYRNGFNKEDHYRLRECLKNSSHHFFLTYDDVPEIRNLYKWANIYEVNFFYRVDNSQIQQGKRKIGFELIITNYQVNSLNKQFPSAMQLSLPI